VLASDTDRDRVVQALKEAYVQGRLTHEELDQRLAAALRSRTTEEVQALLDDLRPRPAPPTTALPPPPLAPYQQQGLAPYVNWWPALAIGVLFLGILGETHSVQYFWWLVFPVFFWFRGGRRHRYRGPRL
jgi:hypothetical protein